MSAVCNKSGSFGVSLYKTVIKDENFALNPSETACKPKISTNRKIDQPHVFLIGKWSMLLHPVHEYFPVYVAL